MKTEAHVHIFGAKHISTFHWEVEIFGVICTKQETYKSIASAKRSALNWCKKLGLNPIVVDEDIYQERSTTTSSPNFPINLLT